VQDRRILASVRRTLPVLVLVVFATLFVCDPIVCPDGCTNDHQAPQSTTPTGAACAVCQSGISLQQIAVFAPSTSIVRVLTPDRDQPLNAVPLRRIDHPPRIS
jgi:hypothetical protein